MQGAYGGECFVVESGQFDVLVCRPDSQLVLVHTYTVQGNTLPAFGELSLLYAKQHGASIVARSEGAMWLLSRESFKRVMASSQRGGLSHLRAVDALSALTWGQLDRLVACMAEANVPAGAGIALAGANATTFGVVLHGQVRRWLLLNQHHGGVLCKVGDS